MGVQLECNVGEDRIEEGPGRGKVRQRGAICRGQFATVQVKEKHRGAHTCSMQHVLGAMLP